MVDSVTGINYDEKFFLHYNFPPFSTGEARPLEELQEEKLVTETWLKELLANMIPEENHIPSCVSFRYFESNGSLVYSYCFVAGTLALMDWCTNYKTSF